MTQHGDALDKVLEEYGVPAPFIVFSLPRSRSAWLTHFLSYPPFQCGHDVAAHCESMKDFLGMFAAGMIGTCETGAIEAWRVIREEMPECKFVVIKRPVFEVLASLDRLGLRYAPHQIIERANMLESVAMDSRTLVLNYAELGSALGCRRIFEHCLDVPFDWSWWEFYSQYNIQVDVAAQMELTAANTDKLARFRSEVAGRLRQTPPPRGFN